MKAISLIWILCVLLLGYVQEAHEASSGSDPGTEICQNSSCCDHGCCCLPAEDGKDPDLPDKEEGCGDDCQCDATAQFLAVYIPEDEGQIRSVGQASFGTYLNQYHFDFKLPHFQPPRLI